MSAIVKYPDGRIVLYCKGADSVIYERLEHERAELEDSTSRQMDSFAQEGKRMLYKLFSKKYKILMTPFLFIRTENFMSSYRHINRFRVP